MHCPLQKVICQAQAHKGRLEEVWVSACLRRGLSLPDKNVCALILGPVILASPWNHSHGQQ